MEILRKKKGQGRLEKMRENELGENEIRLHLDQELFKIFNMYLIMSLENLSVSRYDIRV